MKDRKICEAQVAVVKAARASYSLFCQFMEAKQGIFTASGPWAVTHLHKFFDLPALTKDIGELPPQLSF
jgi:hypothetical protein